MPLSRAAHKSAVGGGGFTGYSARPANGPGMKMRGMVSKVRTGRSGGFAGSALICALAISLLAAVNPAFAQSSSQVGDFRLPSATPTPTSRAQGPVDPDNPYATRPRDARPTPTPVPTPAPTAAPAPAPVVVQTRAQAVPGSLIGSPRRITPAPRNAPPVTDGPPQSASAGTAAPAAGDVLPPSAAIPAAIAPSSTPDRISSVSSAAEPAGTSWWPWLAGLAALVVAAAIGGFALRRRASAEFAAPELERPVVAERIPPAPPEPAPVAPALAPPALTPHAGEPLTLALVATRMSATLINTALSYRIALTNTSDQPLEHLAVSGDMIAAHATRDVRGQLALDGQPLAPLHRLAALAPGETAELEGQLRLPLTAITPIKQGEAALFIPLARFRVELGLTRSAGMVRSFVVGQPPVAGSDALLPFRLDLGPRLYAPLSQRELIASQ